jgi:hypothetical protein
VTLVDWEDTARWKMINKTLALAFFDPVETYSSSPHVYEELDIPTEARGSLPRSQRKREGLEAEQLEDIGATGQHRSKSGGAPRERRGRDGSKKPARATAPKPDRQEPAPAADAPARRPRQRRRSKRRTEGTGPAAAAD